MSKLRNCVEILDSLRVPLSGNERAKLDKIYPYYGAQGVVDYVDSYIFDGDHILVAEDGNNLRSLTENIATWATGKFWVNNHAHILGAKSGYNLRFIYYQLCALDLRGLVTGSAQPKLSQENLANVELWLPPKDIQDGIANVLSAIDAKIDLNSRICAELEAMAKTLYDYWFVQFDFPAENGKPYRTSGGAMEWCQELGREVPKGWKAKRVSELTKVITGKEDANFSTADGEYKFFTCGQETLCCDTPAFTGKAVLIAGNGDFNVKHYTGSFNAYQRTYVLIPNEDKYFAAMFIAAKDTIQSFRQGSNGSIVKFITKGDVENITLLSPTNDDLLQRLNGIIEQIELFEKENDELIKLRDWLLPMLMNGQAYVKIGGDESV